MRIAVFFILLFASITLTAQVRLKPDSLQAVIDTANTDRKSQAYNDLMSFYVRSDLQQAKLLIQDIRKFYRTLSSNHAKAYSSLSFSTYTSGIGELDSSEYWSRQAVKYATSARDTFLMISSHNSLGYMLVLNGKASQAIAELIKGLNLTDHFFVTDQWIVPYYTNLMWAHLELKQYRECIAVGHRALRWMKQKPLSLGRMYIINNMAASFNGLHQLDSVIHYANQSIKIAEDRDNNQQIANSLFIIGSAYRDAGKLDLALSYYEKATPYRDKTNNPFFKVADLYELADLYYKMKAYQKGVAVAEEALSMSKKHNLTMKLENSYLSLARNYEAMGNYKKASENYQLLAVAKDSIYKNANAKAIAEMQTRYETERKERELAESKMALTEKDLEVQQRNNQLILAGAIIFVIAVLGILIYRNQKNKQYRLQVEAELKAQLAEVEAKNAMQQERLRISRELHDNIGSQLTFINSSIDSVGQSEKVEEVKKLTLDTIRELRKTVWLVNQSAVTIDEFVVKLREYLNQGVSLLIAVRVSGTDFDQTLSSHIATHIFRVIQEAVNNALKHANASSIKVELQSLPEKVSVIIADDGIGFSQQDVKLGFGIKNMKDRIASLDGKFELSSESGKTEIRLTVPLT